MGFINGSSFKFDKTGIQSLSSDAKINISSGIDNYIASFKNLKIKNGTGFNTNKNSSISANVISGSDAITNELYRLADEAYAPVQEFYDRLTEELKPALDVLQSSADTLTSNVVNNLKS